jgi:peptidyl-prolyl cis-trans isomerase SDCCAG10
MANRNEPNDNQSQFFITVDKCPWLDKKHTIFGKVVGDTMYNLLSISELDTDKNDRPLLPPTIKSVEVTLNPFDDIVIRDIKPPQVLKAEEEKKYRDILEQEREKAKKKKRVVTVKNKNLLSFQEDEEEEDIQGNQEDEEVNNSGLYAQRKKLKETKKEREA